MRSAFSHFRQPTSEFVLAANGVSSEVTAAAEACEAFRQIAFYGGKVEWDPQCQDLANQLSVACVP